MGNISVAHPTGKIKATIQLPASKSESNRALIINALSGNKCDIQNVSEARDTVTMNRLLRSTDKILDVIDAGTTMRFLTAYTSLQNQEKVLTGTERMCERPIALLVDALREIGADIEYQKHEGFPPILVKGIKSQTASRIKIRGDVSSQYISALLMIAPSLPKGLTIELTGEIGSKPYIMMTLQMMADFGITYDFTDNMITVAPQTYQPSSFFVESDWSGASYWFDIAALAEEAEIELIGLKKNSLQGDAAIVGIMEKLGISTTYRQNAIFIKKENGFVLPKEIEVDFANCPDIAQTLAVICAAKDIRLIMTGVESLKIKETDRLAALKSELAPFGVSVNDLGQQRYEVVGRYNHNPSAIIHTYKDHRMAMAFAPLGIKGVTQIEEYDVVVKSYPRFWDDLTAVGFTISYL